MGRVGEGSGEDGVIIGQLDKIVCMYGIVYICTTDYKNSVLILGGWDGGGGPGSRVLRCCGGGKMGGPGLGRGWGGETKMVKSY